MKLIEFEYNSSQTQIFFKVKEIVSPIENDIFSGFISKNAYDKINAAQNFKYIKVITDAFVCDFDNF